MKRSVLVLVLFFLIGHANAQVAAGNRQMGIVLDMAQNNNFDSATIRGLQLCMDYTHFVSNWKASEPVPNQIGGAYFDFHDIINIYYPAFNVSVEINIPVMNTVTREVPSDLDTARFNSQVMIDRFETYLDSVFVHIPAVDISILTIGNESDILFLNNPQLLSDFTIFYDSVATYARQRYFAMYNKVLKVGTTLTFDGLTSVSLSAPLQQLNQSSDVISVTYYPLTTNFQVRPPNSPLADFTTLVNLYNDTAQPIWFVECGYPSSSSCGSSDAMQSDFFNYVFQAWDNHAASIRGISMFKLTDWNQTEVDTLAAYYGFANDTAFKEYLRTLGIRTWPGNGTNKIAYDVIRCNVNARNFCNTGCVLDVVCNCPDESSSLIYPIPASDQLTIVWNQSAPTTIEFYALDGRLVFSQVATSPASIAVAELAAGIYTCVIRQEDGVQENLRVIITNN